MKQKLILFIYWQILCLSVNAQMHDNIWLFGYGGGTQSPPNDTFGITAFTFDNNKLTVSENFKTNMNFNY